MRKLLYLLLPLLASLGLLGAAISPASATSGDASNPYVARSFPAYDGYHPNYKIVSDVAILNAPAYDGEFTMLGFHFQGDTGYGGYVGLQTQQWNPNCPCYSGAGAIFTIWNATGVSAPSQTYAVSDTEAGQPYKSVHRPMNWALSHWYRIEIEDQWSGSDFTHAIHAQLTDISYPANGTYDLGWITVPSTWSGFQSFISDQQEEYYPNYYSNCSNIHKTVSQWGYVVMQRLYTSDATPTSNTPGFSYVGACTNSYVTDLGGGSYALQIGDYV